MSQIVFPFSRDVVFSDFQLLLVSMQSSYYFFLRNQWKMYQKAIALFSDLFSLKHFFQIIFRKYVVDVTA